MQIQFRYLVKIDDFLNLAKIYLLTHCRSTTMKGIFEITVGLFSN